MARRPPAAGRRRPSLGQHFLRDAAVRDAILDAVPDDGLPILEVGPGRGVLTAGLAASGRPLVGVEFDEALADWLRPGCPPATTSASCTATSWT